MGQYINFNSKGEHIGVTYAEKIESIKKEGAVPITEPKKWENGLVIAINNGHFGAVAYAYNESEMTAFIEGHDGRPHQWFLFDKAKDLAE